MYWYIVKNQLCDYQSERELIMLKVVRIKKSMIF